MTPTHSLGRIALSGIAVAILLFPFASAQVGTFGSTVSLGDTDYIPLMKADSKRVGKLPADVGQTYTTIVRGDLGKADDSTDDCWFVDTDLTAMAHPEQDLRLTPCLGKPAGGLAAEGEFATQTDRFEIQPVEGIRIRIGDIVKQNGKFDKGEPMYLVYFADADPSTAAYDGTPPTTGIPTTGLTDDGSDGIDGDWAIRLTPYLSEPAGSLVRVKHMDLDHFGEDAVDVTASHSVGEREDKSWYLVNSGKLAKNLPVTVKSIRLGPVGTPAITPLVQLSGLDLPDEAPVAGEEYKVTARFSNDGKSAGPGLLVTKLDGVIVDAHLTNWIDPGQGGSALIEVVMPHGGPVVLEVSGFVVELDVQGLLPGAASDNVDTAALEARIANLESQVATQSTDTSVAAARGSPGIGTAVLMVGLTGLAVVLRRKA